MNWRCEDSARPVFAMAARSLSEASCWNHSSQSPPMPCSGLRNNEPARKLSLLQCQNVQNQTKLMLLSGAPKLRLNRHPQSRGESTEMAFDPSPSTAPKPVRDPREVPRQPGIQCPP